MAGKQFGGSSRTIGVSGATGIGVGAIVGGGIFVLAGTAYAEAGPAATIAFALNAVLAYIAAFSFAELATRFPDNGGTYTYAKKVLSVRMAFGVGWVLWFAHIVTAVLYALGFATFLLIATRDLAAELGWAEPAWLRGRNVPLFVAATTTCLYSLSLARRLGGGGQWANIGKIAVFVVILIAGIWALISQPLAETKEALSPFVPGGFTGLMAAMGFTFITLQGVGLIAAVAGEIRDPERTIPRAMFVSLSIAVVLYVPLVFVVSAVGVEPGQSIRDLAVHDPDASFAAGVRQFMGTAGYWLVIVAAILSTLSALSANLLAASRVALSMAKDGTLPMVMGRAHEVRGTPVVAVYATCLAVVAVLFMVPGVAAAGAAASLIFLVAYVLTHLTAYLARLRSGVKAGAFRTPLFPLLPLLGAGTSAAVAIFQAVRVPQAGGIALVWLGLGFLLYLALFKSGAETRDESAEALDPELLQLRGKSPLVLVPIANPAHARAMVDVANALAPSEVARVMLLSIVPPPRGQSGDPLAGLPDAQRVVKEALETSFAAGHAPVAMISAAPAWLEIRRIATEHDCQSLLIGLGPRETDEHTAGQLESLINELDCDVAIFRAPDGWSLDSVRRIMVPVGGGGDEHGLRARVIASLCRGTTREVTFVSVAEPGAGDAQVEQLRQEVAAIAAHTSAGAAVEVLRGSDPAAVLTDAAAEYQLVILGLQTGSWGKKSLGEMALRVARNAPCAVMLLGRHRTPMARAVYRPLRDAVSAAIVPHGAARRES